MPGDKRITELTELATTPHDDDYFAVVDVSDTSMAATGTDKKLKSSNLPGGAPSLVITGDDTHQIVAADMSHNCTLLMTADYGDGGYLRLPATANSPAVGTIWNFIIKASADGETPWLDLQKASTASAYSIFGLTADISGNGYPIVGRLTYIGSNVWVLNAVQSSNGGYSFRFTNAD